MAPVIFITDGLIFLLLVMVFSFVWYARGQEHLRAPWRAVARNSMAMASAVILFFYLLIGVMDSIHFHPELENVNNEETQYSTEILSLLDVAITHLRAQDEKTYSAPFASYAYSKETIEVSDGSTLREYPRLNYGGAHLSDPEQEKTGDILLKSVVGVIRGLIVWCLVSSIIIFTIKCRARLSFMGVFNSMLKKNSDIPWKVIHLTIGVVIVSLTVLLYLSNYYHILGTDKVGQDVFYQSLKSVRTGLVIGTLTTLVMLPFAILMGLMAGYFRGWIDDVIQYLYTTLSSIPSVLLIAAAILMLQVYMANHADDFVSLEQRADMRLLFLCIILGITSWTGLCRMLRGEAMKLREIDYVQAAQAFGVGHFRIIMRHLLPNVMHIVMISIVLDFSGLVLAEAVLSYINIGVDPSMHSWGNMINSARLEMAREPIVWWSLAAAFVFMFVLVLAANLLSDAVRDAFDPRLRESIA
ncbi:MAG: ABC transporter permease [Proteobacteria bacterium]|nr:ABC transporter permease [Pseudomonadota bacterium]